MAGITHRNTTSARTGENDIKIVIVVIVESIFAMAYILFHAI